MSPNQYRTLEAVLAAGPDGMLVARGIDVPPGRIHPRTAEALARRGLIRLEDDGDETVARIATAGIDLLARNPTGVAR